MNAQTNNDLDLILVRSDSGDGGWSLHAPGTTDDEIANGEDQMLLSGEGGEQVDDEWERPNAADYAQAQSILKNELTPAQAQAN